MSLTADMSSKTADMSSITFQSVLDYSADRSFRFSDMSSIHENMSESEIQRLNEEKLYKFMGIQPVYWMETLQ